MKITKEKVYIIVGILCIIVFGVFYTIDYQKKRQEVYHLSEISTAPPVDTGITVSNTVGKIKVYIAGAVKNPGVYELDEGSRIEDVLKLAGGETDEADMLQINLAAYVKDAQQIVVPAQGAVDSVSQPSVGGELDGKVNINTADADGLMKLPGVGQATADNIIQYRTEHGAFRTIEDIKNVTRIGEKTFEKLKDMITVE